MPAPPGPLVPPGLPGPLHAPVRRVADDAPGEDTEDLTEAANSMAGTALGFVGAAPTGRRVRARLARFNAPWQSPSVSEVLANTTPVASSASKGRR